MRSIVFRAWIAGVIVSAAVLAGCQQELMPTPNICARAKDNPFANVPAALQSSRVEVLYATDRAARQGNRGLEYGYERSKSLAFGTCTVEIGHDLSWDALVRESRTQWRSRPLPLTLGDVKESSRFPEVPDLIGLSQNPWVDRPEFTAQNAAAERQLHALLSERLARTPCHEVYIFIHGFNNSFQDAAFVMAGLWHFMGRQGVPIVYTWPAGSPEGALGGYTHDSESGQFTGYHLRHFLRAVAACPDLKKIHLIAHSRGTDVVMTALRELNLEFAAAGKHTGKELKLGNLILAAADLDMEVTGQRITAERLPLVPERMTVYVSETDRALGAADFLFGSKRRIGQLRSGDLGPAQRQALKAVAQMQIIDARVRTGFLGHSYFHESPAVSSDVILVLRDNRDAGAEHGRPLTRRQDSFWEIDDAYPRPSK